MARLLRDLPGAEPVDGSGAPDGSATTLPAGTEIAITVAMLHRPGENLEIYWSEIEAAGRLYRVTRRALDRALMG